MGESKKEKECNNCEECGCEINETKITTSPQDESTSSAEQFREYIEKWSRNQEAITNASKSGYFLLTFEDESKQVVEGKNLGAAIQNAIYKGINIPSTIKSFSTISSPSMGWELLREIDIQDLIVTKLYSHPQYPGLGKVQTKTKDGRYVTEEELIIIDRLKEIVLNSSKHNSDNQDTSLPQSERNIQLL